MAVQKKCSRKKIRENDIIRACIYYLKLKGYEPLRNNSGMILFREGNHIRAVRMGIKGSPDIVACSPDGRFIAVECKANGNRLTAAQERYLANLKRKNAIVIVARSVEDLERAGI